MCNISGFCQKNRTRSHLFSILTESRSSNFKDIGVFDTKYLSNAIHIYRMEFIHKTLLTAIIMNRCQGWFGITEIKQVIRLRSRKNVRFCFLLVLCVKYNTLLTKWKNLLVATLYFGVSFDIRYRVNSYLIFLNFRYIVYTIFSR